MKIRRAVLIGAVLTVAGCGAVGPDFRSPEIALADTYVFGLRGETVQAAQDRWWLALNDPVLNGLMARALADNLGLARSTERINAARALLGTTGLPAQVSGNATVRTTQSRSEDTDWRRSDSVEIQPSFVFDLFGRQARAREAALGDVATAEFERAAGRLGLQLELVGTYLELRAAQAREAELKRTVRNRARLVSATRTKMEAGQSLLLDLRVAEAEQAMAEARIPDTRSAQDLAILRIATLLATPANGLIESLKAPRGMPTPPQKVDPGVPAALLRNRPDIRAAEAELMSATAEIGIRQADLYPSLSIGGTVRVESTSNVALGPALTIPIFDNPLRRARLNAARARAEEAYLAWQETVFDGVEEVQAALVRLKELDRELALLNRADAKLRSVENLSQESFRLGETVLTDLLATEQDATSVRLDLIATRLAYARAWAQLNTAIGQGWRGTQEVNLALVQAR